MMEHFILEERLSPDFDVEILNLPSVEEIILNWKGEITIVSSEEGDRSYLVFEQGKDVAACFIPHKALLENKPHLVDLIPPDYVPRSLEIDSYEETEDEKKWSRYYKKIDRLFGAEYDYNLSNSVISLKHAVDLAFAFSFKGYGYGYFSKIDQRLVSEWELEHGDYIYVDYVVGALNKYAVRSGYYVDLRREKAIN
jgi:hypothetical protein